MNGSVNNFYGVLARSHNAIFKIHLNFEMPKQTFWIAETLENKTRKNVNHYSCNSFAPVTLSWTCTYLKQVMKKLVLKKKLDCCQTL